MAGKSNHACGWSGRALLAAGLLACKAALAEPVTLAQAEQWLAGRNREILAAQRMLDGAVAGVTIAGQAPNPTLSWSAANIDTRHGVGGGNLSDRRVDQTVALNQLIERGDKRGLRAAAAQAQARAAQADLADTRRQQRLALHQSYFDLLAAQERARLTAETAALYRDSQAAAEKRLKAGDLAAVDVSRLRVEALRADNDSGTAQADLARARHAFAYLVGREAQAESLEAADSWPAPAAPPESEPALERRPDARGAQQRIEAAAQARNLARSLATRDVTVGAQVERYPPASGVTYGINVSIPLFARYGYEGEAARAESDYGAALEARERVLAQARVEAGRARTDLAAAHDRLARTEAEVLPSARQVADAAEFAYRKGALGLTDLLDARRTLRAVELDAVAARADHAKARAAWLAATEWETASRQQP